MKKNMFFSVLFIILICSQFFSCALLNKKNGVTIEVLAKPIEQTKDKFTLQDLEEIKVIISRRIEALGDNPYSITIKEKE